MDQVFYTAASGLSRLYQWIAWPFYSARLTHHRLAADLSIDAHAQLCRANVGSFANFLTQILQVQEKLADGLVDIRTEEGKRTAVEGYKITLQRMRQRFEQGLPEE